MTFIKKLFQLIKKVILLLKKSNKIDSKYIYDF
jgi:hypothetical protein